jgi:hypothetical protein
MCPRITLCAIVIAVFSACTPLRSKLPPPYPVDGRQLSASEMNKYAEDRCMEAQGRIQLPPHAFTTDGCSASPDSHWLSCCLVHDVAYWCGAGNRRLIDQAFKSCLLTRTNRVYANVAYLGVRLGGGRFLPFPWRFGYGSPWPHKKATPELIHGISTESEAGPQNPPTAR